MPSPARAWIGGLLALGAATGLLWLVRERADKAHVVLVLLLVVLGGSAAGGRRLGIVLAIAGFLIFNFVFLPPYYTLVVADPLDWFALVAFLATGIVAAQLLANAQREARRAARRADEVDRLAALGSETLGVARAEDALGAIARVVADTLGVSRCEVFPPRDASGALAPSIPGGEGASELVQWVAAEGRVAWQLTDGTTRMEAAPVVQGTVPPAATAMMLPLRVRDRTVGVLRLSDSRGIALDPTQQRYLDALSHYAALGVERLRLTNEAAMAETWREADRMKDALLATVSHDLRTPLTTIRGLAHDIAREGDERAVAIEEEVVRLNRLVGDLLDLSRLNAGGLPLSLAINTADELMGAALQRVGAESIGRDIRASIAPAEPLLVGIFDLAHSVRILSNLLENALKYAPADTPIDFTVRRDGTALVFDVADRGPGVPETERDRIFAPFYRSDWARSDAGGAGLGLAIARGLAEAQHGSLTCSARPGGGALFTLRLPATDLTADIPEGLTFG